jgi:hypothetical protein
MILIPGRTVRASRPGSKFKRKAAKAVISMLWRNVSSPGKA